MFCLGAGAGAARAELPSAQPTLVKNVSAFVPGSSSSSPVFYGNPGPLAFFRAETVPEGTEIWVTDGTAVGTHLARDIRSEWGFGFRGVGAILFGGRLAFIADDGTLGLNPWVSDGTPEGTYPLVDLFPGRGSSDLGWAPLLLGASSSRLYFCERSATVARLWASDGSVAGTDPLDAIFADLQQRCPSSLTALEDGFLGVVGIEPGFDDLLRFTQTGPALDLVRRFPAGNTRVWFTDEAGRNLLAAEDAEAGVEPWTSDGTANGTARLKDIRSGSASSSPFPVSTCAGRSFFTADDGVHGRELWSTNGTEQGTDLARDLNPGPEDASFAGSSCLGDRLLLVAGPSIADQEVWVSDGSLEGTIRLTDLISATGPSLHILAATDTFAMFVHRVDSRTWTWITDGTPEGTSLLLETPIGALGTGSAAPIGGQIVFGFDDGTATGHEPWITNGTGPGTHLLADLRSADSSSNARLFASWRDRVAFKAESPGVGNEVWATDGSAAGTERLTDLEMPSSHDIGSLLAVGGRLLYTSGSQGRGELRVLAGDPVADSILLDETHAGEALVANGTGAYFFDDQQARIWDTDGTTPGTLPYWDAPIDATGLFVENFDDGPRALGGIFFSTGNYYEPQHFYFLDEDADLVRDLGALTPGSSAWGTFAEVTQVGDEALFSGGPGNGGLMRTDGFVAESVLSAGEGSLVSPPEGIEALGDAAFFSAFATGLGQEPWISDGTPEGTAPLLDLYPGIYGSSPGSPRTCRGRLFFAATTPAEGREVWVSDGTANGTVLLKDIGPGLSSGVGSFFDRDCVSSWLLFTANDGAHGAELWASDGTTEGTIRIGDTQPGPRSFYAEMGQHAFVPGGSTIVFSGSDQLGREPWKLSLRDAPFGVFFEDFDSGEFGGWSVIDP